jgi:hypothetical protein
LQACPAFARERDLFEPLAAMIRQGSSIRRISRRARRRASFTRTSSVMYFETMRSHAPAGSSAREDARAPKVAVINGDPALSI